MRKIKYTEEDYQAMCEAIRQKVEANTVDSSVKIDLPGADQKACLNFTGLAWLKMRQLVACQGLMAMLKCPSHWATASIWLMTPIRSGKRL